MSLQTKCPKGYRCPAPARDALKEWAETNLPRSVAAAAADYARIFTWAVVTVVAWQQLPWWLSWLFLLIAWQRITFCLRGLECLTHEGGHWNWSRSHRRWNDRLTNALAAFPVFSSVERFRSSHTLHHGRYKERPDPDLRRITQLRADRLDRRNALVFARGIARAMPRYLVGWWIAIGTDAVVVRRSVCWHASAVLLPLSLLFGFSIAISLWAVFFLVPFLVVLPIVRFIGETAKHTYDEGDTVFESTISNLGWIHRWFVHPHGDGYHLLHHLYPSIPHHRLRRAHERLVSLDPLMYGARHRFRTRILQTPQTSLTARHVQPGTALPPTGCTTQPSGFASRATRQQNHPDFQTRAKVTPS